jgi:hypothetical protein
MILISSYFFIGLFVYICLYNYTEFEHITFLVRIVYGYFINYNINNSLSKSIVLILFAILWPIIFIYQIFQIFHKK